RLYYNGNGILLTGDAEATIENAMTRIFKSGLRSSVLKVCHHGSRYSSGEQFLKRVRPRYAFIQSGINNTYGHPHKEALDRLTAVGAKIFLTTGGTQSVTIPAPGKDVSFPAEPVFDEPVMTAEREYTEMKLTWEPAALENAGSEALDQLKNRQ
ncbi:MAG: hypothetical protein HY796_11060, partial [Elusimicrobia bacterium]|nr:hypothetical protein [Elusimicrobiota bacterium]